MQRFRILLLAFLLATPLYAVSEYYEIARSPRAMGMGGAFYALSDDQYALFYNPAGLSLYRGSPELMLSVDGYMPSQVNQIFNTVGNASSLNTPSAILNALAPYQGSALSAGASIMPFYLQKNFAVGLLVADTKINAALLGNNFDSQIDVTGISDTGIFIGYGRSLFDDHFHVGFTTKLLGRVGGHKTLTALDLVSPGGLNLNLQSLGGAGIGLDFDLGAIYELPTPIVGVANRLSLTFNNLLASNFDLIPIQGTPPGLPRLLTFGSAVVLPSYASWLGNINILLDLAEFEIGGEQDYDLGARYGAFFKHVNFGVEVPFWGILFLRGGIHQGDFTAGLGVESRFAKLEFATYAEQLDLGLDRLVSRRYMLQLTIGAGSSTPPPLTAGFEKASYEPPPPEPKPVERTMRPEEPRKPQSEMPSPTAPQPAPEQNERQPAPDSVMNTPVKKDGDRFDTDNLAKDAYGK